MMVNASNMSPMARVFAPVTDCLPPEIARQIVDSHLDPAVQRRLNELAPKANSGTLSESERAEYSGLVEGVDALAIFKAGARLILANYEAK